MGLLDIFRPSDPPSSRHPAGPSQGTQTQNTRKRQANSYQGRRGCSDSPTYSGRPRSPSNPGSADNASTFTRPPRKSGDESQYAAAPLGVVGKEENAAFAHVTEPEDARMERGDAKADVSSYGPGEASAALPAPRSPASDGRLEHKGPRSAQAVSDLQQNPANPGIEHDRLVAENDRLKRELVQCQIESEKHEKNASERHQQLKEETAARRKEKNTWAEEKEEFQDRLEHSRGTSKMRKRNIDRLEQEIMRLEVGYKRLTENNRNYMTSYNQLRSENSGLRAALGTAREENERMGERLTKSEKGFREFRLQMAEMITSQDDDNNSIKISDETISAWWRALIINVRNFVRNNLTTPKALLSQNGMHLILEVGKDRFPVARITHLVKDLEKYQDSPLLLESYIWSEIHWIAFKNEMGAWAGKTGKQLISFSEDVAGRAELIPEMGKLASGSAKVAEALDKALGIDLEILRKGARHTMQVLSPCVRPAVEVEHVTAEFESLLHEAFRIQANLLKSRASFRCSWPETTISCIPYRSRVPPLNPDLMEVEAGLQGGNVDVPLAFIISPVIKKRGNADGENYEHVMVIAKARVAL